MLGGRPAPAMAEPPVSAEAETLEVGVTGGDLPFWRATEAVRYAQMKLSGQVQASQSLESRATSLTGWSVAALLALGAAVAGGTHETGGGRRQFMPGRCRPALRLEHFAPDFLHRIRAKHPAR